MLATRLAAGVIGRSRSSGRDHREAQQTSERGGQTETVSNNRLPLSHQVRALRAVHNVAGLGELACLGYLWVCAIARRRDRWLGVSVSVLTGEAIALLVAKGCPLGIFQRRAGDDVPMFELWFGRRRAPFAIPTFALVALGGLALVLVRRPRKLL